MENKKQNKYDLIIVGAGPAGLSASIYASRYKIKHLVIGQMFDSSLFKAHLVENYPGFEKIKGADLILRQIVTSVSEGVIAAASIYGELKKKN